MKRKIAFLMAFMMILINVAPAVLVVQAATTEAPSTEENYDYPCALPADKYSYDYNDKGVTGTLEFNAKTWLAGITGSTLENDSSASDYIHGGPKNYSPTLSNLHVYNLQYYEIIKHATERYAFRIHNILIFMPKQEDYRFGFYVNKFGEENSGSFDNQTPVWYKLMFSSKFEQRHFDSIERVVTYLPKEQNDTEITQNSQLFTYTGRLQGKTYGIIPDSSNPDSINYYESKSLFNGEAVRFQIIKTDIPQFASKKALDEYVEGTSDGGMINPEVTSPSGFGFTSCTGKYTGKSFRVDYSYNHPLMYQKPEKFIIYTNSKIITKYTVSISTEGPAGGGTAKEREYSALNYQTFYLPECPTHIDITKFPLADDAYSFTMPSAINVVDALLEFVLPGEFGTDTDVDVNLVSSCIYFMVCIKYYPDYPDREKVINSNDCRYFKYNILTQEVDDYGQGEVDDKGNQDDDDPSNDNDFNIKVPDKDNDGEYIYDNDYVGDTIIDNSTNITYQNDYDIIYNYPPDDGNDNPGGGGGDYPGGGGGSDAPTYDITVEDDDFNITNLAKNIKSMFGLLDDPDTPAERDGLLAYFSAGFDYMPSEIFTIIIGTVSSIGLIAILRAIFKR